MIRHRTEEPGVRSQDSGWKRAGSSPTPAGFHPHPSPLAPRPSQRGITLVEMLIAMAITLVMMGAVVTLFANVSNSVRNRRAVIELSGQMRQVRNVLQRDLQGATCPGLPWQRPEHNRGYIEIIEGQYRDMNPSILTDGTKTTTPPNPELDPQLSIIPRNNAVQDYNGNNRIDDEDRREHVRRWNSLKVRQNRLGPDDSTNPLIAIANGLGDYDDILMLTVRNEDEPFVGRVPSAKSVRIDETTENVNSPSTSQIDSAESFQKWDPESIESPLAEVVWFAVENPAEDADGDEINDTGNFFGEPGMRTVYRRALLIAPWLNPYRHVASDGTVTDTFSYDGDNFVAQPGLLRILPNSVDANEVDLALAGLIAFQERYDVSARLEFDPLLGRDGRWKIVANTLGDLTKRENRYEHIGYVPFASPSPTRGFPFPVVSIGSGYSGGTEKVLFVSDPELAVPTDDAEATAHLIDIDPQLDQVVGNYSIDADNLVDAENRVYAARPLAFVDQASGTVATARAILNDEGEVVHVVRGLVPLSGDRRGEDVMLTNALAFDLRVFDPGAPLFGLRDKPGDASSPIGAILEPGDPEWYNAYQSNDNMRNNGSGVIGGSTPDSTFAYLGQGAYVDLGYGFDTRPDPLFGVLAAPKPAPGISFVEPWFFTGRPLLDVYGNQLAPGYIVYDTWSFHYENDGINEDGDFDDAGNPLVDESTNGLDDFGNYFDASGAPIVDKLLGVDDVGERETTSPYDRPLRGVQVILRAYETDSRQIRQVSVKQNFAPE